MCTHTTNMVDSTCSAEAERRDAQQVNKICRITSHASEICRAAYHTHGRPQRRARGGVGGGGDAAYPRDGDELRQEVLRQRGEGGDHEEKLQGAVHLDTHGGHQAVSTSGASGLVHRAPCLEDCSGLSAKPSRRRAFQGAQPSLPTHTLGAPVPLIPSRGDTALAGGLPSCWTLSPLPRNQLLSQDFPVPSSSLRCSPRQDCQSL